MAVLQIVGLNLKYPCWPSGVPDYTTVCRQPIPSSACFLAVRWSRRSRSPRGRSARMCATAIAAEYVRHAGQAIAPDSAPGDSAGSSGSHSCPSRAAQMRQFASQAPSLRPQSAVSHAQRHASRTSEQKLQSRWRVYGAGSADDSVLREGITPSDSFKLAFPVLVDLDIRFIHAVRIVGRP
jgi:hypothetical protein